MSEKKERKPRSFGRVCLYMEVAEGDAAGLWVPQEIPPEDTATVERAEKWLASAAADGRYVIVREVGFRTVKTETTTVRRVS